MSKRTFIILMTFALAVVVATGGLIASNMGFKLNYQLNSAGSGVTSAPGGDGVSDSGTNTIALPYNVQAGLVNTGDLANDMGGFTATGGPVLEMQYFLQDNDGFNVYAGGKATLADNLGTGQGMRVRMSSDLAYIVVGSHAPTASISLVAAGGAVATAPGGDGVSDSGTNEFAVPYHTTAANTGDLANDIGGFTATGGPVLEMQTFLRDTDGFNVYSGGKATLADNIVPGTSIRIRMGTTTPYTPSHY